MLDYRGCGMSVMEMSHRSKVFDDIIKDAEKDLRELMNIPDNYKVLFLQGGASQQFAAVPMNLMKNKKAGYIVTGQWCCSHRYKRNPDHPEYPDRNNPEYKRMSDLQRMQAQLPLRTSVLPDKPSLPTVL